jgi:hypothetical protein
MAKWFMIKLKCHIIYLKENKISAEEMLIILFSYGVINSRFFGEQHVTEISILISIPLSALWPN